MAELYFRERHCVRVSRGQRCEVRRVVRLAANREVNRVEMGVARIVDAIVGVDGMSSVADAMDVARLDHGTRLREMSAVIQAVSRPVSIGQSRAG